MVTLRGCARWAVFVLPVIGLAALLGCAPAPRPDGTSPRPHRAMASADGPVIVPPGAVLANPSDLDAGLRKPRHVLALSSGGLYGAYSAGVLDGWSRTGLRPEFDVVTGTSTGALIAPFAFLGSHYDAQSMKLYTGVRAEDIFRARAWITIPFRDALATSAPLKKLIESQVNQDLMAAIAAEHRKGRRLYVGTTDLRTKRTVIWDMGAIACRPPSEGCALFRDVLLASASIPGVAPPVPFRIEVDGQQVTEYHTDGGITAPLFVPPNVFMSAAPEPGEPPAFAGAGFYAIVAGKLYPDEGPVRRRILPVLGASTAALLAAHCRAELANMYWQARYAGMRYHMIALSQDAHIQPDSAVSFDQDLMKRLYEEGRRDGEGGPNWMYSPPALSPCDGDYARGSSRLRTMPTVPISVPSPSN
ncbi:patatin-like phospholipase family protein [Gemmata sp. JC717]|uniref:patatin-like phospholipase family protein n=1 Tax=Gemmata algarum TaxID=2975278 RepID=UPI0021BB6871|nr:patatin-like phospholipase family protein [Gemmata algarum]MDY3555668.1 patatin-like phospholipase family protein [Gemmata algarum]